MVLSRSISSINDSSIDDSRSNFVVLTMPAFNEESGIAQFLAEIIAALGDQNFQIIVVDDCSTDRTREVLASYQTQSFDGRIVSQSLAMNHGHGPATLHALREALKLRPTFVVAVDGDGQFFGEDIKNLIETSRITGCDVCEGVRRGREEAWFRRFTTLFVRLLVAIKAGSRPPQDANTPLRVYRSEVLTMLLCGIPSNCLVPNLVISSKSRKSQLKIVEIPVRSLPRRGGNPRMSTMFGIQRLLPTKKFLQFLCRATFQFISTELRVQDRAKSAT